MSSVAVIDYGMGNLHSISKALQHVAPKMDVRVVADVEQILQADRVVFPGVGAIRDCMLALDATGFSKVIKELVQSRPVLGVCLGMQALLSDSEENDNTRCLDIIPGHVVQFAEGMHDADGSALKIPHMGWNRVFQQHRHPLWESIPQNSRFYFVHSFYAKPNNDSDTAATSEYPETFSCALIRQNLFAVQFHPEKSQAAGLQLLSNFLHWNGDVC